MSYFLLPNVFVRRKGRKECSGGKVVGEGRKRKEMILHALKQRGGVGDGFSKKFAESKETPGRK